MQVSRRRPPACSKIAVMQIACPNCSTAYQIAAQAIGANGRTVRCARCANVWFVQPPGIIPAAMEATASETAETAPHPAARPRVPSPESPDQPQFETSLRSEPAPSGASPMVATGDGVSPEPDAGGPPAERVALSDISIPLTHAPP